MSATNRIPRLLQHIQKPFMHARLHSIHALHIHHGDALVYRRIRRAFASRGQLGGRAAGRLVVCVSEAGTPVAEVGGGDEDGGRVCEVGREEGAECALGGGICGADEDGDEGWEGGWVWECPLFGLSVFGGP